MATDSWDKGIPPGFGTRLREERKRLGKSQAEFAAAGGVGRLAQIQYENESTAPSTRYLSGIAAIGTDLAYLILGLRFDAGGLTKEQEDRVERKAFELVEACAETEPDGRLSAESRRLLYRVFRSYLTQVELGKLPADFDVKSLVADQVAHIGGR